jgi:hypothetical protein
MSSQWHRERRMFAARTQGAVGFYDSAYQIALFPVEEPEPETVVDHEITHVNLVNKSSLGLLENVILLLWWEAKEESNSTAAASAEALSSAVLACSEIVHEAVAWLGTQLQTEGHVKVPDRYSREVKRLRNVLDAMPQKPLIDNPANFDIVMSIAEEIGTYALNIPLVGEMWAHPEGILGQHMLSMLGYKPNDPLSRFKEICACLEGVPFPEMQAWVREMADSKSKQRCHLPAASQKKHFLFWKRDRLPVVFRSDLLPRDTASVIRSLAMELGLFRDAGEIPSDDDILKTWQVFKKTHMFQRDLDRYSQVAVLEAGRNYRELLYATLNDARKTFLGSGSINVARTIGSGTEFNFARGTGIQHVILRADPLPMGPPSDEYIVPTCHADFESARDFLKEMVATKPVVASSLGYDFSTGDFKGANLLKEIPHVVVTIRDFRSLWWSIAWETDNGLVGCRIIEWRAMPSPMGEKPFGFLLMKPSDRPFPIVMNPSLISQYPRTVSVADRMPSPHGTRLIESEGNPYQWLGGLKDAVMAAVAAVEGRQLAVHQPGPVDFERELLTLIARSKLRLQ